MKISLQIDSQTYGIDFDHPYDISIPLQFFGDQPNAFGVPKATARAYEDGNFVGDTRKGGSCNFEEVKLIPHCNGTHTEAVGHITHRRISIHTILNQALIPATLITVQPEAAEETPDTYTPEKAPDDRLLTRKGIVNAVRGSDPMFHQGLIIRTLPNDESKKARDYMRHPPPFFSLEAMKHIVSMGVQHLLVDVPSLERIFDEGRLSTHRIYWDVPPATHEVDAPHSMKTITEMIYVPGVVPDGRYVLNIQIPPFVADASPSRPLLYPILPP